MDYGTLVLTAAPFFFMAQALSPSVTHQVGYFFFFGAYVVLFTLGLCLLGVQNVRHSRVLRKHVFKEELPPEELVREAKLRQFWLLMNSVVLLVLLFVFSIATQSSPCPVAPKAGDPTWFLYAFGAIAIVRDTLDYGYSWRLIYPLPAAMTQKHPWPLSNVLESRHPWLWSLLGYLLVVLCIFMGWQLRLWDVPSWIAACS